MWITRTSKVAARTDDDGPWLMVGADMRNQRWPSCDDDSTHSLLAYLRHEDDLRFCTSVCAQYGTFTIKPNAKSEVAPGSLPVFQPNAPNGGSSCRSTRGHHDTHLEASISPAPFDSLDVPRDEASRGPGPRRSPRLLRVPRWTAPPPRDVLLHAVWAVGERRAGAGAVHMLST